ncbi:hypothetical protein [Glycomyces harbinensis]|uniref:Uncharacterized protein n=1 Tax=Glycomyces harbinensis TaxID=58114 RepID=A0A1G6VR83_9ACTN|nr:hypothetical protein [Glycomyces harbinensis]SDD55923.1 hypothetical protein SAMN05216270_10581 [Glycomyces harbinensis]
MEFPFSASTFVLGVVALGVLISIGLSLTPRARADRAAARLHRQEMTELRSRVAANARRTYDKQFRGSARNVHRRRYSSHSSGGDGGGGGYGGDSSCDSGGGGGDGGGC